MMRYLLYSFILLTLALNIGCSTVDVRSAAVVELTREASDIPEAELLDIGIRVFNGGLADLDQSDEDTIVFPEIRLAEASYFPQLLMQTLQDSSAWGAVRVIPSQHQFVDVVVDGTIIESDGETLTLAISVNDAQGKQWFKKTYTHRTSSYSYKDKAQRHSDPFRTIYNQIANDLNNHRQSLTSAELVNLRKITQLKFAQSLAPIIYQQHLGKNAQGHYTVKRLPAENDPMLARVQQIKDRDNLFIDTLQQYYESYAKEMSKPYQQWRSESYREVIAVNKLKQRASQEKVLGIATIIAGILGVRSSDASARAASTLAVSGGAYVIKSGYDRDSDAQIHIDTLQELGDSLEASIAPSVIELEDRTVTLTGTVSNQYQQWREILQQIYQLDTGIVTPNQVLPNE
ncbi:hypothetical protein [Psychrobium sp. 1_MG-2023]|uniref:hypothetical protein n=1 Tax=Psychrobium sp. 1_MG-2023 TaxID=3062624 RepID=UPI000C342765|nr:hypothetical protein [Psychrobium sp. 1_MG-2023]MDP2562575.1 hypothetical protein [Psychrobium sp. 1_MG-2023]PKF59658.1 hypothetical protein CW748_00150 [Alteromonadales bacterium alter-6D02]